MSKAITDARKAAEIRRATLSQRPMRKSGASIFHVNVVVPDDGRKQYAYLKGLATAAAGPSEARLAGFGGIYYRPMPGDKLVTVNVGENQYVVAQVAKDGTDVFSWLNDGDLLIAPPGNIYFEPGGEIMGLLEDFFPSTSGFSLRFGFPIDADAGTDTNGYSTAVDDDCYLFNLTLGATEYDDGDYWNAHVERKVGGSWVDEVMIVYHANMKGVPENVHFQKPVSIKKGERIRVQYHNEGTACTVWVDLDYVR